MEIIFFFSQLLFLKQHHCAQIPLLIPMNFSLHKMILSLQPQYHTTIPNFKHSQFSVLQMEFCDIYSVLNPRTSRATTMLILVNSGDNVQKLHNG